LFDKLFVMVKHLTRDRDNSVTSLPILVPSAGVEPKPPFLPGTITRSHGEADQIVFQQGTATHIQAVQEFVRPTKPGKRFIAMARMFALLTGQKVDVAIFRDSFDALTKSAFGRNTTNALATQAWENPRMFAERWLVPVFNEQIKNTRLVMRSAGKPAIFCPDTETALFVHFLFQGIASCVGCGQIFSPDRQGQLYHDLRCGNAHRKRRERERAAKPSGEHRHKAPQKKDKENSATTKGMHFRIEKIARKELRFDRKDFPVNKGRTMSPIEMSAFEIGNKNPNSTKSHGGGKLKPRRQSGAKKFDT
jgi:hypothetical protein